MTDLMLRQAASKADGLSRPPDWSGSFIELDWMAWRVRRDTDPQYGKIHVYVALDGELITSAEWHAHYNRSVTRDYHWVEAREDIQTLVRRLWRLRVYRERVPQSTQTPLRRDYAARQKRRERFGSTIPPNYELRAERHDGKTLCSVTKRRR